MFARLLELVEKRNEKKAKARSRRSGKPADFKRIFPESQSHLRWSNLTKVGADELMRLLKRRGYRRRAIRAVRQGSVDQSVPVLSQRTAERRNG